MKAVEDEELLLAEERRRLAEERKNQFSKAQQDAEEAVRLQQEKNQLAAQQAEQALARARAEAEQAHLAGLAAQGRVAVKSVEEGLDRLKLARSAKELFREDGDSDAKKKRVLLDPAVKEFLLRGAMLLKHSNSANPRKRHVFVSADFTRLCWKNPKKPVAANQYMLLTRITSIDKGRCTPQLMRTRFGKALAQEEHAFAVFGSALNVSGTHDRETRRAEMTKDWHVRTVDLECNSPNEAAQWMAALRHVLEWAASEKLYGSSQVHMHSNPMGDEDGDVLFVGSDDESDSS